MPACGPVRRAATERIWGQSFISNQRSGNEAREGHQWLLKEKGKERKRTRIIGSNLPDENRRPSAMLDGLYDCDLNAAAARNRLHNHRRAVSVGKVDESGTIAGRDARHARLCGRGLAERHTHGRGNRASSYDNSRVTCSKKA